MKNKYLALFLLLFLVSCRGHATNTTSPVDSKYDYITAEKADEAMRECEPSQRWFMHIGGVSALISQTSDCLNVDNLLIMATPNDEYTNEIRRQSLNLLGLHFLEHLKRSEPDHVWSLEQIGEFNIPAAAEGERSTQLVLYKINSVSVTCTGNTCRRGSDE